MSQLSATRAAWPARSLPVPVRAAAGEAISPGFLLFLVVNATLFVRPAEIIPALLGWQIFLVLILACLGVSFPLVLAQLLPDRLSRRPITLCVLGLLVAVVLSHLSHFRIDFEALDTIFEFAKVVVYYLLFVALVNTPSRLRRFLWYFAIFCAVLATLSVLQYHEVLELPGRATIKSFIFDASIGREVAMRRLQSTGIFQDPNDFCLIAVVGLLLCAYWLNNKRASLLRWLWLAPIGVLGYAILLTQSRGGFVALVAGLAVYAWHRFGWMKSLLLGAVFLPAALVVFAGRQTTISAEESTGQSRIQLWSDGLQYVREAPLFGIGANEYGERSGHVAHNSFLHAFAELGLFGGVLFLGAFYVARRSVAALGKRPHQIVEPEMRRLFPYLLAVVTAYGVGMLALSLCYVMPTFTILGLATAYGHAVRATPPVPERQFDFRMLTRMAVVSVVFLVFMYVVVRVFVRWA